MLRLFQSAEGLRAVEDGGHKKQIPRGLKPPRDDKQRRGVATRRSTTPTSAKSALAGDHGSAAGRECFNGDTKKDSAREVREYFIPDFSNWKDHDSYQAGLVRLISDLKAGS